MMFEIENVNVEFFWFFPILGVNQNIIEQNWPKNRVCYFEFFCVNGPEVDVTIEVFTPNIAV